MKLTRLITPAIAAAMLASVAPAFATPARVIVTAPVIVQERGWDAPPAEYDAYHQQGFHDGIEGARKDFENHRPFTPENRDEYRHPHVPANVYHDYREAFREGYHRAVEHFHYHY